ncbi:MAG: hypothetical protein HQL32_12015 [Planctomycetes bacterium]|nr:hypothetical protein [Planctomycetota bacterium]
MYSLRALLKDQSLDPLDYPKFTVDNFGIRAIDYWEGGLPKEGLDSPKYMEKVRKSADFLSTWTTRLVAYVVR